MADATPSGCDGAGIEVGTGIGSTSAMKLRPLQPPAKLSQHPPIVAFRRQVAGAGVNTDFPLRAAADQRRSSELQFANANKHIEPIATSASMPITELTQRALGRSRSGGRVLVFCLLVIHLHMI